MIAVLPDAVARSKWFCWRGASRDAPLSSGPNRQGVSALVDGPGGSDLALQRRLRTEKITNQNKD